MREKGKKEKRKKQTKQAAHHKLSADRLAFGYLQLLTRLAAESGSVEVEVEGLCSLVEHAATHSEPTLKLLLDQFKCDPNLRSPGAPDPLILYNFSAAATNNVYG